MVLGWCTLYQLFTVAYSTDHITEGRTRTHGGVLENRQGTRYDCSALRVVKFMLYSER